jgi:hypothetical protein
VEIGIPNGRFQVIRVYPNEAQPDGSFILRIEDTQAHITFITSLSTEDGLKLRDGLTTAGDAEHAERVAGEGPGLKVILPSGPETRVHGGGSDRRAPREDEPAAVPAAPAEAPAE